MKEINNSVYGGPHTAKSRKPGREGQLLCHFASVALLRQREKNVILSLYKSIIFKHHVCLISRVDLKGHIRALCHHREL